MKRCEERYKLGLDCSGAVRCWLLSGGGPDIGYGTWAQLDYCRKHGQRVARPYPMGAIVFLDLDKQDGAPSHVGIASGSGTIIECTSRFNGVVETPESDPLRVAGAEGIWQGDAVNAWRIFP